MPMNARYPGACSVCRGRINVGESIHHDAGRTWHVTCPQRPPVVSGSAPGVPNPFAMTPATPPPPPPATPQPPAAPPFVLPEPKATQVSAEGLEQLVVVIGGLDTSIHAMASGLHALARALSAVRVRAVNVPQPTGNGNGGSGSSSPFGDDDIPF